MPAKSKDQQYFMYKDSQRKKQGKRTRTGMTLSQLEEYAKTATKGLPRRKRKKR